jgi:anti-sigma factor RsiW
MRCELGSHVQAYHDGELDAALAARFESHLDSCADCQGDLLALQSLSDLIAANSPSVQMSFDALQRLHDEVDRTMDRSLLPLARNLVGIAAAVLIVAMAGLWRLQPQHAGAPQPWEGTILSSASGSAQLAEPSQSNGGGIDPEIIIADLSRRPMH